MRNTIPYLATALLIASPLAFAQSWEIGGLAGGGYFTNATVKSPVGSGNVGFKPGPSFGAIVGSNMNRYISGELRYEWQPGDLKVSGSGGEATFNGDGHAIHYDFLLHARPTRSKIRPFVAAGGGVKIYRGTGKETAAQALSRLALLTKTTETKGMISVGAGVKTQIAPGLVLRVEFRDFITPFPRQVIAPSVGASISGWVHDFVPLAALTFVF